jgi:hypothetical protein
MTYLEATQLAADPNFQARVKYVLVKAARQALAAAPPVPGDVAYARQVLNNPTHYAEKLALGVVTLPTVLTLPANPTVTDAALESAVLGVLADYVKALL